MQACTGTVVNFLIQYAVAMIFVFSYVIATPCFAPPYILLPWWKPAGKQETISSEEGAQHDRNMLLYVA